MSDTKQADAPHIDIVKQANGFYAVVHAHEPYSPQLVTAPTLDDMHRSLVSVLVSEFHIPQDRAERHIADGSDVRHVEDTIMAAHQRGVLGMSKQLQDANKALAAAKAENEEIKKKFAEMAAPREIAKAEAPKADAKPKADAPKA